MTQIMTILLDKSNYLHVGWVLVEVPWVSVGAYWRSYEAHGGCMAAAMDLGGLVRSNTPTTTTNRTFFHGLSLQGGSLPWEPLSS